MRRAAEERAAEEAAEAEVEVEASPAESGAAASPARGDCGGADLFMVPSTAGDATPCLSDDGGSTQIIDKKETNQFYYK